MWNERVPLDGLLFLFYRIPIQGGQGVPMNLQQLRYVVEVVRHGLPGLLPLRDGVKEWLCSAASRKARGCGDRPLQVAVGSGKERLGSRRRQRSTAGHG